MEDHSIFVLTVLRFIMIMNSQCMYPKMVGCQLQILMILTLVDIVTNMILVYNLNKVTIVLFVLLVSWMVWKFVSFIKDPERFVLVEKVEIYTYIQESLMLITVALYLIVGKI